MAQATSSPKETPAQAPPPAIADVKLEMEAISKSLSLFEKLPAAGRQRAISYLASALGVPGVTADPSAAPKGGAGQGGKNTPPLSPASSVQYETFADLYDAAGRPPTGADKALVGGYWFQVCKGQEDFVALDVNNELKQAGEQLSNVTVAMNTLRDASPSLVLQVRKSGKAQQARKQYKLSTAGIRAVEAMIRREV